MELQHCPGVQDEGEWREGCEDCARPQATGKPSIEPPILIVFWCEWWTN